MTTILRSFFSGFVSSLSTKKISQTHKKKLNSVCTGLVFTLALLVVPAAVGFPSTLSCHVAVKSTICDMLLNHEKLGTDTLLPTPSESHEYSLGLPTHIGLVCCFFCLPGKSLLAAGYLVISALTITSTSFPHEFLECSRHSLLCSCVSLLTVRFTSLLGGSTSVGFSLLRDF